MSLKSNPIRERQCWVSYVRYDRIPGEGEEQSVEVWEAPMGIYCTSAVEYDKLAAEALRQKGLRFLGSVTPKPTNLWFTAKGYDAKLAELTPKVDHQNWARWGRGKQVGFETPINARPKAEDESPLIITEHAFGQLPDQSKIWPPMDRTWIDPQLKDLLFSQSLPKEHQHILSPPPVTSSSGEAAYQEADDFSQPLIRTYFIADAHLRRKITKVFDLNDPTRWKLRPPGGEPVQGPNGNEGHVRYRSLFKGEAAEELKEVAPYLFEITLPELAYQEDKQVPRFHKAFFQELHDEAARERAGGKTHLDTGIFIRTTQRFEEVWKHFRKFTRIQDENGKWYLWRFWDAKNYKIDSNENVTPLAGILGSSSSISFNILIADPFIRSIRSLSSKKINLSKLKRDNLLFLDEDKFKTDVNEIEELILSIKAGLSVDANLENLRSRIKASAKILMSLGFKKKSHIHQMVAWDLFLSKELEENPTIRDQFHKIMNQDLPEPTKFWLAKNKILELSR